MLSFIKTLCISHLHVQYIVGHSVYFCRVSVAICDKCDYEFIFGTITSSVYFILVL